MRFSYDGFLFEDPSLGGFLIAKPSIDYQAVGLRLGMNFNFRFNASWSIFAMGAGSVLCGNYKTEAKFFAPALGVLKYHRELFRTLSNLEGAFGIDWETDYAKGKYHFRCRLAYELVEWFHQNQLLKPVFVLAPSTSVLPLKGDLWLQGGTLSFHFDF
jgi:hypothetical protein